MQNPFVLKKDHVLRNPNFTLLFMGKLVSQFGDAIYNLAIGWFILDLTKSGTLMALYMTVGTVTFIILGPIGGVVADHWNRKYIMVAMDIFRGLVVALVGFLLWSGVSESVLLSALFVTSFILSICGALFNPASMAIIPMIVKEEQLTQANAFGSIINSASSIFGVVLGGIFYGLIGIQGIFVLNAISYILSGISETWIRVDSISKAFTPGVKGEFGPVAKAFMVSLKEGYDFIRQDKRLYYIVWAGFFLNFVGVALFAVFTPFIFNQILQTEPVRLSYNHAALAVGMLLGALVLGRLPQKEKVSGLIRGSLILQLIPMIAMTLVFSGFYWFQTTETAVLYTFLISFFFLGLLNALINIPVNVILQKYVPNALLGRVNALFGTLIMAAMPFGMMIGGIMADVIPMVFLLIGVVVLYIIMDIIIWFNKSIREL